MEGEVWDYEGCDSEMRFNERYVKFYGRVGEA